MPHISYPGMPSARALVFRIPELVVCLSTFLTHHDLAQLTLTSRQLHSVTTPLLWNRLDLLSDDHPQRLLASADALNALARNVRHIRSLTADTIFFSYYLDALTLHLDRQPTPFGTSTSTTPVMGFPLPLPLFFPGRDTCCPRLRPHRCYRRLRSRAHLHSRRPQHSPHKHLPWKNLHSKDLNGYRPQSSISPPSSPSLP